MSLKETILPLADAYADVSATHQVHAKERAALCAALDAADREIERLTEESATYKRAFEFVGTQWKEERDALKVENANLKERQEPIGWISEYYCLPECACEMDWVESFTRHEPDHNEYTRNIKPVYARAALGDGK